MDIKKNRIKYSYPYLIWMFVLIVAPLLMIFFYAFTAKIDGNIIFSFENFARAFDPVYLKVFFRSVGIATASTVICLLLGYPIALILSKMPARKSSFMSMLFIIPMWMNFLLRTYAWMAMLDMNGLINKIFGIFGLGPFQMLYNMPAILMGMVYNYLPFMILPIYNALQKIPNRLVEAAFDLGADERTVFRKVTLPLSLPGVISGITMVFIPGITTFAISRLLGGAQYMLYGDLIENQFMQFNDPHFGSSLSIFMMIVVLICTFAMNAADNDLEIGSE